jgi:hypothetical protein
MPAVSGETKTRGEAMKGEPAPPKTTGGEGFVFENDVCAYFLAVMLSGRQALAPLAGALERIDFQTRADGWMVDDALLTIQEQGSRFHAALSIKDCPVLADSTARSEVVKSFWAQFLHHGSNVFDRAQDLLCLVVPPEQGGFAGELEDLISLACKATTTDLASRLEKPRFASQQKRKLWTWFACPKDLADQYGVRREHTGDFLKCVRLLTFDFGLPVSKDVQNALAICQDLLESGSAAAARALWDALRAIANEARPKAGSYSLPALLKELRPRFRLRWRSDHRGDWDKLQAHSKDAMASIQSTIGGSVLLARESELGEMDQAAASNPATVILGPSGSGKSVVTKIWAERRSAADRALWFDARSFEEPDFASVERRWNLSHSLTMLLTVVPTSPAFLVLDGVDRLFSGRAFANVRVLLKALSLADEQSPWRLILTCQPEEWSRIRMNLLTDKALLPACKPLVLRELFPNDLSPVWDAFPQLQRLTLQRPLRSLLCNLKFVDLLARGVMLGAKLETAKWVGESDVINWFWDTLVNRPSDGAARSAFLQRLAESQADALRNDTPLATLPVGELGPLDALLQDRLCSRSEERICFTHDLYGDWARQRILLSRRQDLVGYVTDRLASPQWHRAIRLFGLHLLEQHSNLDEWRAAMADVRAAGKESSSLGDLLLEAAITAPDPLPLLEALWPDLQHEDGRLLRRLLGRFLHMATLPNPLMVALARDTSEDLEVFASTHARLPYWPYWLPMLRFLHAHREDVVRLDSVHIARIADTWLRQGLEEWPLRDAAADLGLTIAEAIRAFMRTGGILGGPVKMDALAYRAALAAAKESPERVKAFALEACGRVGPGGISSVSKQQSDADPQDTAEVLYGFPSGPWPDGPILRPDHAFRDVALTTDAMAPLIAHAPQVAGEVTLALLIEEPESRRGSFLYSSRFRHDSCIRDVHEWYPPLYVRGLFLSLLQKDPAIGLDVIVKLVNFMVERLVEHVEAEGGAVPSLTVNVEGTERRWFGDSHVYCWHRAYPPAPHAIVVALMALEKWLYDELDAGHSIDQTLKILLNRSNNLAFAGVMVAAGKKKPGLLLGPLSPLLALPEVYYWDLALTLQSSAHLTMGLWNQPKQLVAIAREWQELPSRKIRLDDLSRHLFLNFTQSRGLFATLREGWPRQLIGVDPEDRFYKYVEHLIASFDLGNYAVEETQDGQKFWAYNPPEPLRRRQEAELKVVHDKQLLLTFPLHCRQLLDGEHVLRVEHLEEFWTTTRRIAETARASDMESGLAEPCNAACGGCAVLVQLHRDWLRQHPDREAWCIKYLVGTTVSPPPPAEFDSEGSAGTWEWDHFCAESVPLLWAEDPASPALRGGIARLVFVPHYNTAASLMRTAAAVRDRLGDDFRRLQHLMLQWAGARWEFDIPRWKAKEGDRRAAWITRAIAEFVEGRLEPRLPPWMEVARIIQTRKPLKKVNRPRKIPRESPGLDVELLRYAFSWIPSLSESRNEAEREGWIEFWREALACTLRMIGTPSNDDWEVSGTPYEFDRWVLGRIASVVPEMHGAEDGAALWQPILDLGVGAHYWVKDFLEEWFLQGLWQPPASQRFIEVWKEMLEHAFASPSWRFSRGWFRLEKLWCTIMGMGAMYRSRWVEAHRSTVSQMLPYYERWAGRFMNHPGCAIEFAQFLEQPAAAGILCRGLQWLAAAAEAKGFWQEHEMKSVVAGLLETTWRLSEGALRRSSDGLQAFKRLLQALVDAQEPVALELQHRMLGR